MRPDERATRTQRARSLALALGEAAGGFLSPHRATVEGLSPAERDAEPALAVGLTWDERCDLYDEMLEQERGARVAARAEAARLRGFMELVAEALSTPDLKTDLARFAAIAAATGTALMTQADLERGAQRARELRLTPPEPSGDAA